METSRRIRAAAAAAMVSGMLAACGGGGGGSAPPNPSANVSLDGTAAKGLMANADVAAFPVNADGSVGTTALATTTTDASGHYALTFTATQGQPYVIEVKAKADGSTTHLDEVSDASQSLPAGFAMRALLLPASAGSLTTSANVTPFSELAVAAAARAGGGITRANAEQAASTVKQLLGFDPTAVGVKAAGASGASENENRQAILLLAVSKLAADSALGCTAGSAGEKVKCVVDALAAASSTTSIKLEAGGTDVSAALGGAVATVLADDSLNGGVPPSTLSTVTANLACTTNCAAAPVATVAAIDAAKDLFAQMKADWTVMFSRGGATSVATGAANAEAWKFREAMGAVQAPAGTMLRDLGAVLMGVDLYNDYKAGRTTINNRGRAPGGFATSTPATVVSVNTVGCTLYADNALTQEASSPANANFIGCRATTFANIVGNIRTDWGHGFTLTPGTGGSFTYGTRARKRTGCVDNSCAPVTETIGAGPFSGTLNTTTDANGSLVGFSVSGDLAGSFLEGGITLADDHSTWSFSGTTPASGPGTSSITGNIASKNAAGAVLGTLTVETGRLTWIAVDSDNAGRPVKPGSPDSVHTGGREPDSGALDLVWTTPTAEFEGEFTVAPSVWDASGHDRMPTSASLSGALRNIAGGTTTEFLKGTLEATVSGFASFDNTQPVSATNTFTVAIGFTGTVTAPTRPTLALTISVSAKEHEGNPAGINLQYRALVSGTPRTVIDVTGTRLANGLSSWTFSEAASGLAMDWTESATQAFLRKGTEQIGVLDRSSRLLTFSDHSVISLDVGL